MDFHSLSRRELQSLCMSNGIKANMTNLAMADALKSLQTVEGIGETPRKTEPKTELPKAGRRAASSRQVGSARPHQPQGSPLPRSRRVTARFGSEILNLAADADTDEEGKDEEWVPETPKAPTTRRRAQRKKVEAVESTIPKTVTTRRRATKKEEEKTVGVTTRRRTRLTLKKDSEDLDVAIRGKSPLKMADLGKDVDADVVSNEQQIEKDVVDEVNDQSVEKSGSTEENEEEEIAQVLPIEQSKEEGEEKDVIEDVLSNAPSMNEETIRVQEEEEKEITQVLPIEQPEEDQICHEEGQQISFSEEEIDSKTEENHAEEEEQDDEERGEVFSDENLGNNVTCYQQEKLESSNDLTQEEDMDDDDEERGEVFSSDENLGNNETCYQLEKLESSNDGTQEEDMDDHDDDDDDEERGEVSSDENLGKNETCYQQEKLESSNDLTQEEDVDDLDEDDDVISEATEESPIKGLVTPCKQQQDNAKEANEEEERREGTDVLLCLQQLSISKSEVDEVNTERTTPTIGVTETVGNKNLILEVGTIDFSAGKAAEEVDDIHVKTTEKFDLLPLLVSDNNKENPTGEGGRQKKIDPEAMSLRKLKANLKESLINKKVEEKRSALKPLEENLLPTSSMEDAVM